MIITINTLLLIVRISRTYPNQNKSVICISRNLILETDIEMRTKTSLSLLSFLFTFPTIFSQPEKQWTIGQQLLYKVAKAKGPITVYSIMAEYSWQNASVQPSSYFYRSDKTPDKQNTKFRMLLDNGNLFLFYEM